MSCIERQVSPVEPVDGCPAQLSEAQQYDQTIELLPVLDLRRGQVVHARQGQRSAYAPIVSPLVAGSAPDDLLAALLACSLATRAYLADLDAILGEAPQSVAVRALSRRFAGTELWVDAGFRTAGQARAILPAACVPVLGTESLAHCEDLSEQPTPCVLSLDFGAEGFRGDPVWLAQPSYWPDRVIVMTLPSVGSGAGPDLDRLAWVCGRASRRKVYAAGGVRHEADLAALAVLGVAGALVASALHAGSLGRPSGPGPDPALGPVSADRMCVENFPISAVKT